MRELQLNKKYLINCNKFLFDLLIIKNKLAKISVCKNDFYNQFNTDYIAYCNYC